MKHAYQIGKLFGIPIKVHITFIFLLFFIGLMINKLVVDVSPLYGMFAIILVFLCVVLHEVSHSLVAKHFGINVRDITLLPIGGVAQIEEIPEDPKEEILIAIAGPVLSLILAGFFLILSILISGKIKLDLKEINIFNKNILMTLFSINLVLGIFNIFPAFPMDGGRVLRGVLALFLNHLTATKIAVGIGQAFAIFFIFFGIFFNWWLILIGFFIYVGAANEEKIAEIRASIQGIPVSSAMLTNFATLNPNQTLRDAVDRVIHTFQDNFPVMDEDKVIGVLTKQNLFKAIREHPIDSPISDFVEKDYLKIHPDIPMSSLLKNIMETNIPIILVMENEKLKGIINLEQIGKFHLFKNIMRK